MSTPGQNINEAYYRKEKDYESSIDDIGKVDMARVQKGIKDDNSIFDGDVTII